MDRQTQLPVGSAGREWVMSIKDELENLTEARKTRKKSTMFRVPPPLRKVKSAEFTPSILSFGLFDRDPRHATRADTFRVEVASAFLETLDKKNSDWDDICARVVPNPREMQDLYDGEKSDLMPEVIQSLLTLDAIFLASYFAVSLVTPKKFPLLENVLFPERFPNHVIGFLKVDVMLLENQIPLHLIRNVLQILYRTTNAGAEQMLSTVCKEAISKYSRSGSIPGTGNLYTYTDSVVHETDLVDCQHLLECLYKVMCRGVDVEDKWNEDNLGNYVSLPTVSQLQAAGIKFKGDERGISNIKFTTGPFKEATLYLPTLALEATTERTWRNLVAYETVSTEGKHEFMSYLRLMDDLIDTQKDVGLLRKGKDPVISHNFLGNDKDVAAMFNSLLHDCENRTSQKWNQLRNEIHAYYNQRYRKTWVEFRETYFVKPWVAIGVVAGAVLLVLTAFQTIYTILSYYRGNSGSNAGSNAGNG